MTIEELASLRHRRKRLRIAAVIWLIATPFWTLLGLAFGFLIGVIEGIVANSNSFSQVALFLSSILGLLLGIPVSILKAKDSFHFAAILSRTMRTAAVRQFAGKFDYRFWNEDTLEKLLEKLIKKRLIEPDTTDFLEFEVYPLDEYIYRLNQNQLNSFFPVHLTIAAAVPLDAARFGAPAEFQPETEGSFVERRRLTTEEQNELQSYARQTLRRRLIYSPVILWCFTSVAWSVSTKFLSGNVSSLLTGLVLAVTAIVLFLQTRKQVNAFNSDAENGWVLIAEYPLMDKSEPVIDNQLATVEFLIHAGHEWTMNGKPASWRKKAAT